MRDWTVWSLLKMTSMVVVLGIVVPAPGPAVAADGDERQLEAYILEGSCDVIKSQPVEELGTLAPDHDAARELAEDMEAGPEHLHGGEGNLSTALEEVTSGEHVVAIREVQDGVSPVIACGAIPEDAGDAFDVEIEPFGDSGVEGRMRLETVQRVETITTYTIGVWGVPPDAEASGDRDLPEVPDFELTLFSGETVHLSDYRGKTVLMVMWASWCPYCDAEFPKYEDIWQKYKDKDVVVLGVGLKNDDQGDAEDFIEKHGSTFPVGRDIEGGDSARGEIESTLGVPGTPAMFVITPDGYMYGATFGVIDQSQLEDAIEDAARTGGS